MCHKFISIINENNPIIQILGFGYLDIDTIQLSNVWIHGYMDMSILYVSGYLDTWILGNHGYLDTWILGYFNFFRIWIMDSQKSLDIQVSGYHIPSCAVKAISSLGVRSPSLHILLDFYIKCFH